MWDFFKKYKEQLVLGIVLLISAISHSFNMFYFPYYENDEGTYMSQAWSLLTKGELAPYTYWYDHAPLGWVLIAIWVKATGGFFTFGTSVDSGRVLMLIIHVLTSYLLFFVTKRLSKSTLAGVLAVIIFSLSPLGIYFQRRVLLDNMMIFWVFVSLALLLKKRLTLSTIFLSAFAFGIAVLTKENAVFFIPAYLYTIYRYAHKSHTLFALFGWLFVAGAVVSYYFLFAMFKGELLPPGLLGDTRPHVSLLATLQEQLSRGESIPFWHKNSEFYINFIKWIEKDSLTIIIGAYASFSIAILALVKKDLRIPALFVVLFWFFLLRGKLVIDFYVVPLLPLLGMAIGIYYVLLSRLLSFKSNLLYNLYGILGVFAAVMFIGLSSTHHFTRDETTPQREAITWIKENVDTQSFIAIDASIYVDLHEKRFSGDPVFPNADWVWKIEKDEEIYKQKLQADWKNIEYVTASHEILKQIYQGSFPNVRTAMDFSYPLETWDEGTTSYINMNSYLSTNGDWFAVYKVKQNLDIILDGSWKYFKENFIISYGQIVNPQTGYTTSDAQAYAMLRAVWQKDKNTFDGVWAWTRDHMQHRNEDNLLSAVWGFKDGKEQVIDPASRSDADTDIALALLFAYRTWGDERYLIDAKEIIMDIWRQEVVQIRGRYYVLSGSNASRINGYLVNPSYMSPAAYRIFAQADPTHDWNKLANDSYLLLNEVSRNGLPPNWVFVDNTRGQVQSAARYIEDPQATLYGIDAVKIMWRVGLDAHWFNSLDAKNYASRISSFYENEIAKGGVQTLYTQNKIARSGEQSLATDAGALSVISMTNRKLADTFYKEQFEDRFTFEKGMWNDGKNYYDQTWAWLGVGLYFEKLPDLYTKPFNQLANNN